MTIKVPDRQYFFTIDAKLAAAVALVLIALTFIFRAHLVFVRYTDPDEMEHLHAAFSIFRGLVPGRDFFQHHMPLYYYFLAPSFLLGVSPTLIYVARGISQIFTLCILFVTFQIARRLFNRTVAWISTLWLSYNFIFLWRTMEIRPDVPALLLFLITLNLLLKGYQDQRKIRWFFGGVTLGAAFLCTQKIAFPMIGILAAIIYRIIRGSPLQKTKLLQFFSFIIGCIFPLLIIMSYFLFQGVLPEIWRNTILAILRWQRRVPPWHLKTLVFFNPFFCVWGVIGFFGAIKKSLDRRGFGEGHFLLLVTALSTVLGSWIIIVSWPEYYLLFIPLLAIYAASGLSNFYTAIMNGSPMLRLAGWVILLISGIVPPLLLKFSVRYSFELPLGDLTIGMVLTVMFLIITLYLLLSRKMKWKKVIPFFLGLAILVRPFMALACYHLSDNRNWLGALRHLMEITGPEDRVLDGWTGLGVFRPHAYYYYYLHEGVLMWLDEREKGEDLLAALREHPPALVISGPYLEQLSPAVRDYIGDHYGPVSPGHPFLVRKGE